MTWEEFFASEQDKLYFNELMTFIDQEYQDKVIFPRKEEIFNAFTLTPFNQVKVVILGQDPYHDEHQAHGLAFSVLPGCKIPPSLQNIFKELESDLNIPKSKHGDLTAWAKRGVLLLNTILTVVAHQPLSHQHKGWETFTNQVIKALNDDPRPKVFVFWGNNAKAKNHLITSPHHLTISSSHPSPLSARHSFFGSKVFSRINAFLNQTNQETINFTLN